MKVAENARGDIVISHADVVYVIERAYLHRQEWCRRLSTKNWANADIIDMLRGVLTEIRCREMQEF